MSTLKRLIFIVLLISLTACSTGLSIFPSPTPILPTPTPLPPSATPAPMALTVNGEGITQVEFDTGVEQYKSAQEALGIHLTDEEASQSVAENYIALLLLAEGASEAGFEMDDAELQTRIDSLADKLGGAEKLSAWQQAHGYNEESFQVALKREAAAAWMRDKITSSIASTTEQVHVRQILLYNEDNAKRVLDQLQAGVDFDVIAAQVDPLTRGDIGWLPRGYLAEKPVEDAAFALEPGKYSDIVKDAVGFHIIKLLERQTDRPLSPDVVLTLQNNALKDWLVDRRQQSSVILAQK